LNLLDAANGIWALTPGMHETILAVIERHARGEVADLASIEAALGRPMKNPSQNSTIEDGVCVIPVNGVLCKAGNMFTDISGASSMQIIGGQFAAALADPEVSAIVLAIDSPGGSVDGTEALANQIHAARGQKPIAAVADGLMASAAYWIGSAADEVFIAGDTTSVGSIGVIASHVSSAGADAQRGLVRSVVASGPLKGVPSSHAPLDGPGRAVLQQQVDAAHAVFRGAVSRNRGLAGAPLDAVSDGRILMGQSAITAGLADGRASVDEIVRRFKKHQPPDTQRKQGPYPGQKPAGASSAIFDVGDAVVAANAYRREQAQRGRIVSAAAALAHVQARGI
jgi:signal peptide peptidase SppA